jgi:hypothetical protein
MNYYFVVIFSAFTIYWYIMVVVVSIKGLVGSYHTVSRCNSWMLFAYCAVNLVVMFYWVISLLGDKGSPSSFLFVMVLMGVTYVYVAITQYECVENDLVEAAIIQIFTEACCLGLRGIYNTCMKPRYESDDNEDYFEEVFS